MAALSTLQNANGRCLKRSFTAVTIASPPSLDRSKSSNIVEVQARKTRQRANTTSIQRIRSKGLDYREEDMPSAAGPRMYENQIPSFMSVYDMDSSTIESPGVDPPSKLSATTYLSQQLQHRPLQDQSRREEGEVLNSQIHSQHQHRESTSTQASDSTESSPTTTISTVDSSSLSDPSPSSSPESPITLVPLSSFSNSNFGIDSFQSLQMADNTALRLPLNDDRPMTSPSPRKPKNPKSLALNLNSSVEALQTSAPPSPSFIKPPALKGRRKPSLLSLNTGAANQGSLIVESVASPGVPTMLQRRGLKHSISSPQMLTTPGFAPVGGMTLGERSLPRLGLAGISRLKDSNLGNTFTINEDADHEPSGVQMATRLPGVTVGGDSFDRPHSGEDAKSPSYPEGPILMHEPSVHLYLEPKLEEAMKFDVVINVAKEVKNPFKEAEETKESLSTAASDSKTITPEPQHTTPDTAASMLSFQTAFEIQPSSSTESSPTTPKPGSTGNSTTGNKSPEYIHVPWDHNTDVKDELWDLCQLIESRTKEGKRVLVHCQQGASRSATLIIAYGMYINQNLGPNEAYSLAQSKSRWVNPNMSLLFSLNDFKKVIEQKKAEKIANVWKSTTTTTTKHRQTLSADTLDGSMTPNRARGNSTPSSSTRDKSISFTQSQPPQSLSRSPDSKRDENSSISDTTIRHFADFDFGFGDSSQSSTSTSTTKPSQITSTTFQEPNSQSQLQSQPQLHPQGPSQTLPQLNTQEPSPAPSSEPTRPIPHRRKASEWEDLMSPRLATMTEHPMDFMFSRSLGERDRLWKQASSQVPFQGTQVQPEAQFPTGTGFPSHSQHNQQPSFGPQPPSQPHPVHPVQPPQHHAPQTTQTQTAQTQQTAQTTEIEEPLFSPLPHDHGFPRSSFFATLQNPLPPDEDPRSPPTKGEVGIIRSIDGYL